MKITLPTFVLLLLSTLARADLAAWEDEVSSGALLLRDDQNQIRTATLLDTDYSLTVSGPLAQVTLTQTFRNPSRDFREGRYLFPLPDNAAVNGMVLTIGERRIVGRIDKKAAAEQRYQAARAAGHTASLVKQQRPNLFTTSVANIAPGQTVKVELRYLQTLDMDGHHFSLRLPLTLTPRFQPHNQLSELLPGSATRLAGNSRAGEATIHVDLDPGGALDNLNSPSHALSSQRHGRRHSIELAKGRSAMNRDFVLEWTLSDNGEPLTALFQETVEGEPYALLMMVPPTRSPAAPLPRETLFIIDTSGSMGGASIRQARAGLLSALDRLRPGDRFNITEFNSQHRLLFPAPVTVSEEHLRRARAFVAALDASGGTNMEPALCSTLSQPSAHNALRQVIFITDGAVSNERQLFRTLFERLGDARLFTVGIGSAPNSHFMRGAARFGRGTFTYIGDVNEVESKMSDLFNKLESPLMRNLSLRLPSGVQAERWPQRLPDLYAGEPLLLTLKLTAPASQITVSGNNGQPWQETISLPQGQSHSGVASLWARRKIEDLNDRLTLGGDPGELEPLITQVALRHQLVSRFTSFVAVDETPSRPALAPLMQDVIANQLPEGSAWPGTATPAPLLWRVALLLLIAVLLLKLMERRGRHA